MLFYELSLVFLFSFFLSVLASFFSVVIYRTAKEESFSKGRSKCEKCHKQIAWYDNIPLLSYLWLGGKCRSCHKKISLVYFLTELLAFLLGIAFYLTYVSSPFLLADLQYLIVPDFFVALLSVLAILAQILSGKTWSLPILAVFFSTAFFYGLSFLASKIMKKDALGMGDIKLMIPLSFILSWPETALSIFLAFIIGGFFAMLVLITGKKKFGQVLPFAPFLILAAMVSFIFGEAIWKWYFGFLF